jgi:hypothetical protein
LHPLFAGPQHFFARVRDQNQLAIDDVHAAHFAAALWLLSCRKELDASRARLFSVEARRTWTEPDIGALPF